MQVKERSQLIRLKLFTITQTVSSCKSSYRPKNDRDIKLKECPAYEKPPDIELEECPAYIEKKKDQDFKLEECPAYVEKKKDQDIKLEDCPAYVMAK